MEEAVLSSRSAHRAEAELIIGLDRDEPHVVPIDCLGNRFGIKEVVLVGLYERLHELSWNQLHVMTLCPQRTAQEMRTRACLHPDQQCLQIRSKGDELLPGELLLQQHLAVIA